MYGKVMVASGSAYLLTFELGVLPTLPGTLVLMVSGLVVAFDVTADGPQHRLKAFVRNCERRLTGRLSRQEREREVRAAAAEELRANYGIRMAEELSDADREWLRNQAALAVRDYESSR